MYGMMIEANGLNKHVGVIVSDGNTDSIGGRVWHDD